MKMLIKFLCAGALLGESYTLKAMQHEMQPVPKGLASVLLAYQKQIASTQEPADQHDHFREQLAYYSAEAHQAPLRKSLDDLSEYVEQRNSQRRHLIANGILFCAAAIGTFSWAYECWQHACPSGSFNNAG